MNRFLADTRHNLKWPQPKGLMLGMNQKITGKVSKRIPIKANNLNVLVYTQDINTTNMHMYHKATPCLRNIVYVQDEMFEETKVVIRKSYLKRLHFTTCYESVVSVPTSLIPVAQTTTMSWLTFMEYLCHKWPHKYVLLVVNSFRSFPHLDGLITSSKV
jgi:hypothetical protein